MDEKLGQSNVAVHVCWDDFEAEIVLSVLREHGVPARSNSAIPHDVMPLTANGLGKVEIFVDQRLADRARAILAEQKEIGAIPGEIETLSPEDSTQ